MNETEVKAALEIARTELSHIKWVMHFTNMPNDFDLLKQLQIAEQKVKEAEMQLLVVKLGE